MIMAHKEMVTAVFRDRTQARRAYEGLIQRGYLPTEINVLMSEATRTAHFSGEEDKASMAAGNQGLEGTAVGGGIGTAVGATIGAIIAAGTTVALPGLGLLVAGPIAGALAGAGAGAVTGGALG